MVKDPASTACAIVDSVMDIDYAAGRITSTHADQLIAHVRDQGRCQDFGPNGRDIRWETTVAEEGAHNIHVAGKSRDAFAALRTKRDQTLAMPKLIIPSLQVNMRGGALPPADEDGQRFLKVPITGI